MREANPSIGALACFIVTIHTLNDDRIVTEMELEHYPGMTEKALEAIVAEAQHRWPGVDALIVHRVGKLMSRDQIVLVAKTAAHRGDAFASCEFVMDYLKMQAPLWKKVRTENGAHRVDAHVSDVMALVRWEIEARNEGD